jgi:hypothetical protein
MVVGKIPKEQCGISGALVRPGTKRVYKRPSILWEKLAEGQHWKLIDEEAQQSTKGTVTNLVANYDASRSTTQGSRLRYRSSKYTGTFLAISIIKRFQILLL